MTPLEYKRTTDDKQFKTVDWEEREGRECRDKMAETRLEKDCRVGSLIEEAASLFMSSLVTDITADIVKVSEFRCLKKKRRTQQLGLFEV